MKWYMQHTTRPNRWHTDKGSFSMESKSREVWEYAFQNSEMGSEAILQFESAPYVKGKRTYVGVNLTEDELSCKLVSKTKSHETCWITLKNNRIAEYSKRSVVGNLIQGIWLFKLPSLVLAWQYQATVSFHNAIVYILLLSTSNGKISSSDIHVCTHTHTRPRTRMHIFCR